VVKLLVVASSFPVRSTNYELVARITLRLALSFGLPCWLAPFRGDAFFSGTLVVILVALIDLFGLDDASSRAATLVLYLPGEGVAGVFWSAKVTCFFSL
jgi:hypothetical protein